MLLPLWNDRPESPSHFLRLIRSNGEPTLAVVNRNGQVIPGGFLLSLTHRGDINRRLDVAPELGFNLNADGRLGVCN